MAPIKRKRPRDAAPEPPPEVEPPLPSRRATRQTSIAPLPMQADPEPRRRRRRANRFRDGERDDDSGSDDSGHGMKDLDPDLDLDLDSNTSKDGSLPPPTRNRMSLRRPTQRRGPGQLGAEEPVKPARLLTRRHRGGGTRGLVAPVFFAADNARPDSASVPVVGGSQPFRPTKKVPSNGNTVPMVQSPHQLRSIHPVEPSTKTAPPTAAATNTTTTTTRTTASSNSAAQTITAPVPHRPRQSAHCHPHQHPKKPAAGHSKSGRTREDPEIDKVVFGNHVFKPWYSSYLDVLDDVPAKGAKAGKPHNGTADQQKEARSITKMAANGDNKFMLYVCPCCFKYSKELTSWWQHVYLCKQRGYVPGERIYVHPRGRRVRQVPQVTTPKTPSRKKKGGDEAVKTVEEVTEDQGEWSIWEVDGEKEPLFCQNLSLFAKLFLENKSVFFDVSGFNYFLLVHTTPAPPPPAQAPDPSEEGAMVAEEEEARPPRRQIVGFFSKEKMSWDNNNLACILVFPPWQRNGLGVLLMGVSYEISRREGVLGGPEKPISDLGKRGYKRFWAGEIAAWILGRDAAVAAGDKAGGKGGDEGEGELILDIDECSRGTWIVPADCLEVLRGMGVAEDAGLGPPKKEPPKEGEKEGEEAAEKEEKEVQRVRISKEAVRAWVKANCINLEKACDPNGFAEGYAVKQPVAEEVEV